MKVFFSKKKMLYPPVGKGALRFLTESPKYPIFGKCYNRHAYCRLLQT
jgi:hypothetical protein